MLSLLRKLLPKNGRATKKNSFCSFCRKSYQEVGPLVEGPNEVYICGQCVELCQSIIEQERYRHTKHEDSTSPGSETC